MRKKCKCIRFKVQNLRRKEIAWFIWTLMGEDNIKIDLILVRWEGWDQIHLSQDSHKWHDFVNTVMNMYVQ
jgi:hypothetical protein